MTMIVEEKVRCAVCGQECRIECIASSNRIGSTDLDTRPPEMMRSTITMWVHSCGKCGYCAPNLKTAADGTAEILKSPNYLAIRSRPGCPAKAMDFLCHALVASETGQFRDAAWSAIHAAWICDDANAATERTTIRSWLNRCSPWISDDASTAIEADHCRNEAVRLIDAAHMAGAPISPDPGAAEGIRSDLLRRAGRFEEARECVSAAMGLETEVIVKKVLRFQMMLIARHDRACHTVAEALEPAR